MLVFKKDYNLKIVSFAIGVVFLFTGMLYALEGFSLRVPVDKTTSKRMVEVIKDGQEIDIDTYLQILSFNITRRSIIEALGAPYFLADRAELYKRLKNILSRRFYTEELIKEDIMTIAFIQANFRDYFEKNVRWDLVEEELTRDFLVQIVRDLFNPFFEREGYFVIDFYAGTEKLPTELPEEELERLGYSRDKELYIYGIDETIPWEDVSARENIGIIQGNVSRLCISGFSTIPEDSVDVVTMFHPPDHSYEKATRAAQRILLPGGWVYIALHPHEETYLKKLIDKFRISLENDGFSNISIGSFPDGFPISKEYGVPGCLINAQKPEAQVSIEIDRILKDIELMRQMPVNEWNNLLEYILRLELLHAMGILERNLLYLSIGDDFFPSYFAKTFGINSETGLGIDKITLQELERKAIEQGLPKRYTDKPKDLLVLKTDNFDYNSYFPQILKAGGADILLIKGLTDWLGSYGSFPEAKGRKDYSEGLYKSVRDLVIKIAKEILNEGGFIVIADKDDLWLSDFIMKELGYSDLLEQPEHKRIKKVLSKDIPEDVSAVRRIEDHAALSDETLLVSGRIPIRIFQKPYSSSLKKQFPIGSSPTDL